MQLILLLPLLRLPGGVRLQVFTARDVAGPWTRQRHADTESVHGKEGGETASSSGLNGDIACE